MKRKKKRKKVNKHETIEKLVLATAILNLIHTVLELLHELTQ